MPTKAENSNWHLSRSISIGHIVTTGLVIISAVVYLSDIKEDVAINTSNIAHNVTVIESAKKSNHDMFKRIDSHMVSLSDKIDGIYKLLLTLEK